MDEEVLPRTESYPTGGMAPDMVAVADVLLVRVWQVLDLDMFQAGELCITVSFLAGL